MARFSKSLVAAVLLLALPLALAAPAVKKADATQTCIMTGEAPTKPTGTLPRCVAEQSLSCCTVCEASKIALNTLSRNGTSLLGFLNLNADPTIAQFAGALSGSFAKLPFCSMFRKNQQCLNLVEALTCAFNCDPAAGSYLSVTGRVGAGAVNATSAVCNDFATQLYTACSTILLPGVNAPLSQYIGDAETMLSLVVAPLVQTNTILKKLQLTLAPPNAVPGTCFSGPPGGVYPTTSLCCDEMTDVPQDCLSSGASAKFADAADSSVLASYINRPLGKECPAAAGAPPNAAGSAPAGKGAAARVSAFSALSSLVAGAATLMAFAL